METAAAGASWLPRLPGVWTWSRLLLLAGLGVLLLESWLCHRHAVY
ncbi:MAG: hypothetical protein KDM64_07980 [Verrucomicrobiae bacterium]|nr:hypothetical protein [Verrucomicrobiae bacterium]